MSLQFRYGFRAVSAITVLVVFALSLIRYNEFLTMREDAQSKRSNFEVQIQRRNNLFGNLINLTLNHAALESSVFNHGADKRTEGLANSSIKHEIFGIEQILAKNGFSSAYGKIMAYSESYPDIKSVKSYKSTMSSLVEMEERIANNRVLYNESASKFNSEIRKLPWKYLAIITGFTEREYFHQGQENTAIINAPIVAPEMYKQLIPLDNSHAPHKSQ
ncbi:magnetosome protein MamQ [Paramagnetospirillum marisnigri]|uniref:magnetosome protein MamQ n=1 Tax=Paramagnetospirillum marisnigri TaxID=1285242 RepID=UPI0009EE6CE4|nr:magnetosome protein MamQ [Paramagnetospirillum marisnigri]